VDATTGTASAAPALGISSRRDQIICARCSSAFPEDSDCQQDF
jgi:hypothetical protein